MRILNFLDGFESSTEPTIVGYPASEVSVTPIGSIVSTDAQSAFAELDSDLSSEASVRFSADSGLQSQITTNTSNISANTTAISGKEPTIAVGTTSQYWRGDKSWQTLDKTAVGLSNVDNTSDSTKNSAAATLQNKTLSSPIIDVGVMAQQGSTPASPSSGYNKYYFKSDGYLYCLSSSGVETKVGTGTGGGSKNYLSATTQALASGLTTGWSLFTTTLTSGLPTGSISAGASSIALSAAASNLDASETANALRIVGASGWTAGQGFISDAFTIDGGDNAKVLTESFIFRALAATSGNANWSGILGSQSLGVYIYDVTNSAWIQPAGFLGMNQSSGGGKIVTTFQSSSTSGQQYRLAILCLQSIPAGFQIDFTNLSVGPQTIVQGTPVTDWIAYTPTFTGFGTPTGVAFYSRRVGDSLEVQGRFTSGTTTATQAAITLGYQGGNGNVVVDTTKIGTLGVIGPAIFSHSTTTVFGIYPVATGGVNSIGFGVQSSTTNASTAANGSAVLNSTETMSFTVRVPIVGWSSQVQMSNDTDTRIVSFSANKTSTQAVTASTTNIAFSSVVKDSHGTWNGSDTWTVAVSGDYVVAAPGLSDNAGSATLGIQAYVNGTSTQRVAMAVSGNASAGSVLLPNLKAGDQINLRSTVSLTLSAGGSFQIFRLSGTSVIAANEPINCAGYNTSGQSIPNSSSTTITGWTKQFDTHNQFSTSGVFTPQTPGKFRATLNVSLLASALTNGTGHLNAQIIQSGSSSFTAQNSSPISGTGQATWINAFVSHVFNCLAGDTLTLATFQNNGASRALYSADSSGVFFSIEKVG